MECYFRSTTSAGFPAVVAADAVAAPAGSVVAQTAGAVAASCGIYSRLRATALRSLVAPEARVAPGDATSPAWDDSPPCRGPALGVDAVASAPPEAARARPEP